MTLAKYLELSGKSPEWLATEIGTTPNSVRRYMNGTKWPRPETIRAIKKATGGAVTADDMLEPSPKKPQGWPRKRRIDAVPA
jgi:DNA-binding transcriptional regulator YdaS (Cro superfamily)